MKLHKVRRAPNYLRLRALRLRMWLHHKATVTRNSTVNGQRILMELSTANELNRVLSYTTKEPDTLWWIDNFVRPGDVFYDIGANIGQYSLYAALKYHGHVQVYGFEPESQNYSAFNRNIYLNNLGDSVLSFCLAISDNIRIDSFYVRGYVRAGGSIHQFGRTIDNLGLPFTPVHLQGALGVSLDDLHFMFGLEFPQCIKVDVDGIEGAVIRGASRVLSDPRLRSVLIEITEVPSQMEEVSSIYQAFEQCGFAVVKKVPARLSDPSGPSHNVIFARPGG